MSSCALHRLHKRLRAPVAANLRHGSSPHETFQLEFEPKARGAADGLKPCDTYIATIARNVVISGHPEVSRGV